MIERTRLGFLAQAAALALLFLASSLLAVGQNFARLETAIPRSGGAKSALLTSFGCVILKVPNLADKNAVNWEG